MGETYADRNRLLRELGYESYAEYLASPRWLRIRKLVLAAFHYRCGVCRKNRARDVHHISYSRAALLGESRAELIPLCGRCHYLTEFDPDDGKRTLGESQKAFSRLKRGVCLTCGRPTGSTRWRYCSAHAMKAVPKRRHRRKRR